MSDFENYEIKEVAPEDIRFETYLAEMSGKDVNGKPLAIVSYQCYTMEESEDSTAKQVSYSLTTPYVQLWVDKLHPGYIGLDIVFRSFDDSELRLLWGRLNRHVRNMSKEPDKTWVFYLRILDNASLSNDSEEIRIVHLVNPTLFFLTRETPFVESTDSESDFGLQGGNIVRMIIPEELANIEISPNEAYDLNTIRAEVQRDIDTSNFLNASAEVGDTWNENRINF